ncbi:MAG: nucleotide disphospho-sugar-binding domain-containing protein [Chakrabartia sp.]
MNMAISQHVLPKPRDWDAAINMAGFIRMPARNDWLPPDRLVRFLDTEKPVIYLGLGSMMVNNPRSIVDAFCTAVTSAGCKLVVSGGWSELQATANAGNDVLNIDGIPHDWLFPKMALIAHHCGAGTTAAAIAAGRPNFAIPFMADQFFWRDRMSRLGIMAGSARKAVSAQDVGNAIDVARNDREMARRCQKLAQNLASEDAVANAVVFIEKLFL